MLLFNVRLTHFELHAMNHSKHVFWQVCNSNNGRRRRDVEGPFGTESQESTTVSVGPIYTRDNGTIVSVHKNLPHIL